MRDLTRNVDDERRASEIEANFQPKVAFFDATPDVKQLRDKQFALVVDSTGTRLLVRIGNTLKQVTLS